MINCSEHNLYDEQTHTECILAETFYWSQSLNMAGVLAMQFTQLRKDGILFDQHIDDRFIYIWHDIDEHNKSKIR